MVRRVIHVGPATEKRFSDGLYALIVGMLV